MLPEDFAARTLRREGPAAARWLREYPAVVEGLLRRWELRPTGRRQAGQVGVVHQVVDAANTTLALKLGWPDRWSRHEVRGLLAWEGNGAVRVLRHDPGSGAFLMEWLRPDTDLTGLPVAGALEVSARLLGRLHRPAGPDFPRAVDDHREQPDWTPRYASRLRELSRILDDVLAGEPEYLLHGDFHYENVLRDQDGTWRAIDPKPVRGPREYDLLPLLRNRVDEYPPHLDLETAVHERLEELLRLTGLDRRLARLLTHTRSLADANYAHRLGETGFEKVALAIARATA
ncbi:hypothetical protein KIH74_31195 [Kineosporia sp. J2-2]|uniref:Streptomycin 6-kinase n=1 Tax=Kineosporia corallincola TaxID=2835133 RepID=A0ABS5TRP2_9ACTN|nr:aminoglycoside phosphotransferase family protein [Kineosporia corallincola]MBT0773454.1 hypothetical protein [Kineosporia corallincola]